MKQQCKLCLCQLRGAAATEAAGLAAKLDSMDQEVTSLQSLNAKLRNRVVETYRLLEVQIRESMVPREDWESLRSEGVKMEKALRSLSRELEDRVQEVADMKASAQVSQAMACSDRVRPAEMCVVWN